MPNREDLRAIARQAQLDQFAEATQSQQPLTTAQLGSIDPSTGLDIVELPDGGTVTGQRIFSAGHPTGTFVRATQATGGQVTLDWRNAPDIPEIAEDDPRRRVFRKKKETDPADVPVLFITKETKAEAIDCRCTTYKRNDEGKFKELCDGSGDPLPGNGNISDQQRIFDVTTVGDPPGLAGKDIVYLPIEPLIFGGSSVPAYTPSTITAVSRVAFLPNTGFDRSSVPQLPNSGVAQQFKDLLKQGSSVIITFQNYPMEKLGDATAAAYEASLYQDPAPGGGIAAALSDSRLKDFVLSRATAMCEELLKPLGINLTAQFSEWEFAGDPLAAESNGGIYSGKVSSTLTISAPLNAPNPVASLPALVYREKMLVRPTDLGNYRTTTVSMGGSISGAYKASVNASSVITEATTLPFNYSGGGDRAVFLSFVEDSGAVVSDGSGGFVFVWQGKDLDPSFSGVVILDAMPDPLFVPRDGRWDFVPYRSIHENLETSGSSIERDRKAFAHQPTRVPQSRTWQSGDNGDALYTTNTQPLTRITRNFATSYNGSFTPVRGASMSHIVDLMANYMKNSLFIIPPRQNNLVKPSKETIAFWLGGCYKTPIKITELTADDPYDAYLSNTPEKIFVTIKASKEEGYKDLDLKKRPWCTITTWEVDKATGDVTTQQFRNPQEVTTNQDDWQKDWAHDYNPIDPVIAKPAKFNIPTNRFGVSTANQTYNLTPFVEAADPQLTPKLVDVSFVSSSISGAGSVLSWNPDNLTFVYKGNTASLYLIEFSYTIDDGASTATSTIKLVGSMLTPNLIYQDGSGEPNYLNFFTPFTYNISGADRIGNQPQVLPGRTMTLESVELISIGVEGSQAQYSNGLIYATPARNGQALSVNPLGSFVGFNSGAFTVTWQDNYVRNGRLAGGYTAKLRYTISDGTDTASGFLYLYYLINPGSFG